LATAIDSGSAKFESKRPQSGLVFSAIKHVYKKFYAGLNGVSPLHLNLDVISEFAIAMSALGDFSPFKPILKLGKHILRSNKTFL